MSGPASSEIKQVPMISTGSIAELFRYILSAIILMDYNEGGQKLKWLSLGQFTVNAVMHVTCPVIFATFCAVDAFHWPLTKDTFVVRMANRTFAFALPLYGLQFPQRCPEEQINALVKVFSHFGYYKDINDKGQGYPFDDKEPHMWNKLRLKIEPLANRNHEGPRAFPRDFPLLHKQPKLMLFKVFRMSAATKMVIESMRTGTLKASSSAFLKVTAGAPEDPRIPFRAFASVNAFSVLVDTVEHGCVVSSGLTHMLKNNNDDDPSSFDYREFNRLFRVWYFNEEDLLYFMNRFEPFIAKEEKVMKEKERMLGRWPPNKGKEQSKEGGEASASSKGKEIIKP